MIRVMGGRRKPKRLKRGWYVTLWVWRFKFHAQTEGSYIDLELEYEEP